MLSVLIKLRRAIEGITEYDDGSTWGQVYLPNIGSSHSIAGHLSVLKKAGYYRPLSNEFGEVLINEQCNSIYQLYKREVSLNH